jgi:hypothetical protein
MFCKGGGREEGMKNWGGTIELSIALIVVGWYLHICTPV